jgi:4-carboxymuconolactone decarboxylase
MELHSDLQRAELERAELEHAKEVWRGVTQAPVSDPTTPMREMQFKFLASNVWDRPGLPRRDHRWISLCCTAFSSQPIPIRAHVRAAIASGDITVDEMREFALHLAGYAGWPIASIIDATISEFAGEAPEPPSRS